MPQTALPKWVLILSALFALMEIAVSFTIYFSPESVVDTVDLSANGVDYLFQMWAVRQFALGVIFAYATFKKSVSMLILAYIFFLVMFAGDLLIGILHKESSLIISALMMCAVSWAMIFVLSKRKN